MNGRGEIFAFLGPNGAGKTIRRAAARRRPFLCPGCGAVVQTSWARPASLPAPGPATQTPEGKS